MSAERRRPIPALLPLHYKALALPMCFIYKQQAISQKAGALVLLGVLLTKQRVRQGFDMVTH